MVLLFMKVTYDLKNVMYTYITVKQVTPVTPMSTDTWNISFAKYLEIRFHGSIFQRRASAEPCGHSLHHDHFQYFGFKDTVASFK